jgi:two-component system phosphate regulon response regulator PhoB/two-component system alkaline phosphatase synthesis response regulator PhoP/two-component system response regulator VicR
MDMEKDILIIDDDRDLVNSIKIVLESKKYNARSAYNGKEGYAKIEENPPDLIVLDVMMATDTEGFDLAFKLKNNPKYQGIPIVMRRWPRKGLTNFNTYWGRVGLYRIFLKNR